MLEWTIVISGPTGAAQLPQPQEVFSCDLAGRSNRTNDPHTILIDSNLGFSAMPAPAVGVDIAAVQSHGTAHVHVATTIRVGKAPSRSSPRRC